MAKRRTQREQTKSPLAATGSAIVRGDKPRVSEAEEAQDTEQASSRTQASQRTPVNRVKVRACGSIISIRFYIVHCRSIQAERPRVHWEPSPRRRTARRGAAAWTGPSAKPHRKPFD